jgi:plasmid stabilization system protein ParE
VARVELTEGAVEDLDRLIRTHNLPADTKRRLRQSLRPLGRFPRLGAAIDERRPEERFVIGPWPWLVVAYEYREQEDRAIVLSIEDARSSQAATARRAK